MPELASIIVPAATAFLIALATLFIARKSGLSDIDEAVREQRGVLVATLTTRVAHLENENKSLKEDIDYLKHENEQLRIEVARLSALVIRLSIREEKPPDER